MVTRMEQVWREMVVPMAGRSGTTSTADTKKEKRAELNLQQGETEAKAGFDTGSNQKKALQ